MNVFDRDCIGDKVGFWRATVFVRFGERYPQSYPQLGTHADRRAGVRLG
jgi:hypothetical protein